MALLHSLTLLLTLSVGAMAMDNPFETDETTIKQTEKQQEQRQYIHSHRPQPVLNDPQNIQNILDKALKKREEAIFQRKKMFKKN